jgi:hypothetical protein
MALPGNPTLQQIQQEVSSNPSIVPEYIQLDKGNLRAPNIYANALRQWEQSEAFQDAEGAALQSSGSVPSSDSASQAQSAINLILSNPSSVSPSIVQSADKTIAQEDDIGKQSSQSKGFGQILGTIGELTAAAFGQPEIAAGIAATEGGLSGGPVGALEGGAEAYAGSELGGAASDYAGSAAGGGGLGALAGGAAVMAAQQAVQRAAT